MEILRCFEGIWRWREQGSVQRTNLDRVRRSLVRVDVFECDHDRTVSGCETGLTSAGEIES